MAALWLLLDSWDWLQAPWLTKDVGCRSSWRNYAETHGDWTNNCWSAWGRWVRYMLGRFPCCLVKPMVKRYPMGNPNFGFTWRTLGCQGTESIAMLSSPKPRSLPQIDLTTRCSAQTGHFLTIMAYIITSRSQVIYCEEPLTQILGVNIHWAYILNQN